jgi:hypothetical protein
LKKRHFTFLMNLNDVSAGKQYIFSFARRCIGILQCK